MEQELVQVGPSSAADFLKAMSDKQEVRKLRNGTCITLWKINVRDVMQKGREGIPLPVINNEEDIAKLPEADRKKIQAVGERALNYLIIDGVASPKFVEGDKSDLKNGVIGLNDPLFDDAVKTEVIGHVFDYNGYSDKAKEFFRLVSPG